ncbi:metallophosphoesterase [Zobellia sp. OII3]|uniref:ligase-associated DNA damage response endonuclease PdeM n=1 Tax=Zobellia sp. OII3 TaxID=2034520 RepID=UPI000B52DBFD|nr:ligase-associated DNA damage response endonuclease PdeM [Zobellia sp. OII3]OWW27134.1 metallophosphoesterase [Zobellia sp. OII3]
MAHPLVIQDHHFTMHPSGVLFWKEKSMLLISDVHLGKISHFRKFGAAVPQAAVQTNFKKMDKAIDLFQPQVIVFMGDLFHSALNKEWKLFENWIATISSEVILVAGNHDIISPLKYEALGIQVVSEICLDGFLLTHHPEEREACFNFCGHIHPAVRLQGMGRQSIRLACFFKSAHQMILPAFGTFTGTHVLEPQADHEIYALTEEEIFQVQFKSSRRRKRP